MHFTRSKATEADATVPLPEIEAALPLAEVYEAVDFPVESAEGELPPR